MYMVPKLVNNFCSAVDYGSGPVSMGNNSSNSFLLNDSHFSTNYAAANDTTAADRIFGAPARWTSCDQL